MSENCYQRPETLSGRTQKYKTSFGNLFITVNCDENNNPIEIMAQIGKSGHEVYAFVELIGRLASLCLQNRVDRRKVINALRGTKSQYTFMHPDSKTKMLSIPDAMGYELDSYCSTNNLTKAIDYGTEEKTGLLGIA
jgi:ribonucleoside-diphosphate reductase alpha chain